MIKENKNPSQIKKIFFISYSRLDTNYAKKLKNRLETIKVPIGLSNTLDSLKKKSGLFRVYLDTEDSVIGKELQSEIIDSLNESYALIVLISPNSVKSKLVEEEIKHFTKNLGRKLIPVIIDGDYKKVAPKIIRDSTAVSLDASEISLAEASYKIVGSAFDIDYIHLWNKHKKERKRKKIILGIILILLATLFAILGSYKILADRKEAIYDNSANARNLIFEGRGNKALETLHKTIPFTNTEKNIFEHSNLSLLYNLFYHQNYIAEGDIQPAQNSLRFSKSFLLDFTSRKSIRVIDTKTNTESHSIYIGENFESYIPQNLDLIVIKTGGFNKVVDLITGVELLEVSGTFNIHDLHHIDNNINTVLLNNNQLQKAIVIKLQIKEDKKTRIDSNKLLENCVVSNIINGVDSIRKISECNNEFSNYYIVDYSAGNFFAKVEERNQISFYIDNDKLYLFDLEKIQLNTTQKYGFDPLELKAKEKNRLLNQYPILEDFFKDIDNNSKRSRLIKGKTILRKIVLDEEHYVLTKENSLGVSFGNTLIDEEVGKTFSFPEAGTFRFKTDFDTYIFTSGDSIVELKLIDNKFNLISNTPVNGLRFLGHYSNNLVIYSNRTIFDYNFKSRTMDGVYTALQPYEGTYLENFSGKDIRYILSKQQNHVSVIDLEFARVRYLTELYPSNEYSLFSDSIGKIMVSESFKNVDSTNLYNLISNKRVTIDISSSDIDSFFQSEENEVFILTYDLDLINVNKSIKENSISVQKIPIDSEFHLIDGNRVIYNSKTLVKSCNIYDLDDCIILKEISDQDTVTPVEEFKIIEITDEKEIGTLCSVSSCQLAGEVYQIIDYKDNAFIFTDFENNLFYLANNQKSKINELNDTSIMILDSIKDNISIIDNNTLAAIKTIQSDVTGKLQKYLVILNSALVEYQEHKLEGFVDIMRQDTPGLIVVCQSKNELYKLGILNLYSSDVFKTYNVEFCSDSQINFNKLILGENRFYYGNKLYYRDYEDYIFDFRQYIPVGVNVEVDFKRNLISFSDYEDERKFIDIPPYLVFDIIKELKDRPNLFND